MIIVSYYKSSVAVVVISTNSANSLFATSDIVASTRRRQIATNDVDTVATLCLCIAKRFLSCHRRACFGRGRGCSRCCCLLIAIGGYVQVFTIALIARYIHWTTSICMYSIHDVYFNGTKCALKKKPHLLLQQSLMKS